MRAKSKLAAKIKVIAFKGILAVAKLLFMPIADNICRGYQKNVKYC